MMTTSITKMTMTNHGQKDNYLRSMQLPRGRPLQLRRLPRNLKNLTTEKTPTTTATLRTDESAHSGLAGPTLHGRRSVGLSSVWKGLEISTGEDKILSLKNVKRSLIKVREICLSCYSIAILVHVFAERVEILKKICLFNKLKITVRDESFGKLTQARVSVSNVELSSKATLL